MEYLGEILGGNIGGEYKFIIPLFSFIVYGPACHEPFRQLIDRNFEYIHPKRTKETEPCRI